MEASTPFRRGRQIDRRAFLGLSLGALAWACSRGNGDAGSDGDPGDAALSVIPTGQQGLAVGDQRNAFVVLRGQKPFAPRELEARLVPSRGRPVPIDVKRERIRLGRGGDTDHEHPEGTEVVSIYAFNHQFDAGVYEIQVIADGKPARANFLVAENTGSPAVTDTAIASDSPTTDDGRGVDPICTRDPVCSMHELSIADALAMSKPVVITFATPRFCTSRTCGPVVDLLEAEKEKVGDDVSFVHVEVFKNEELALKPGGDSPTFAEWKLGTEPWTYFIDADGVIRDRWLGAVGRDELSRTVESLIS